MTGKLSEAEISTTYFWKKVVMRRVFTE